MFNLSKSTKLVATSGFIICAVLLGSAYPSARAASSLLGSAQSFAVLGGSTVTNTGATTVEGDLGVSPGSAVTGFPPGIVIGGTIHTADAVASQAQSDVSAAYNSLARQACDFDLTGQNLGGRTLVAGVYCFSSSAQLTGALTLDAGGNADSVFIFQIGSTLTTASNSSVLMIGGSPCNVYWQVGSSATLGTTTRFLGNILALTSVTLDTGATVIGRALAQNGAVTMDTNDVSAAGCAAAPAIPTATPETPTATPETSTATPETATPTVEAPAPATSTPVTSVPETATPAIPGPVEPSPAAPTAVVPTPPTPTPITSILQTPTPIVPIPETPAPITPTPTLPSEITPPATTSTPVAPIPTTPTPLTPVSPTTTPSTATATSTLPSTATATPIAQTPTRWPTSTPVSTRTPVTIVTFPNTGSGGLLAVSNDQSAPLASLAVNIAIVMLLTAGLGVVVERRSRR